VVYQWAALRRLQTSSATILERHLFQFRLLDEPTSACKCTVCFRLQAGKEKGVSITSVEKKKKKETKIPTFQLPK
jgi:hypothetical protein